MKFWFTHTKVWHDIAVILIFGLGLGLPGIAQLPVIDRDEARYVQTSVQMLETNNYINIKFQDKNRYKKPPLSYWLQSLSVSLISDSQSRDIWAHRLPSLIAALLSMIACYFCALQLISRPQSLLAAFFLGTSFLFIFEEHMAKTDILLCMSSAFTLWGLTGLYHHNAIKIQPPPPHTLAHKTRTPRYDLLVWGALALAIMIKGPIIPFIFCTALIAMWIGDKQLKWARGLLHWHGIFLFCMLVVPWILIMVLSGNSSFFKESLIGDFGAKLLYAKEGHSGFFGYHFLTIWLGFWPACLFLLPGFYTAFHCARLRNTKQAQNKDTEVLRFLARLLLCWIIPLFCVLAIIPTKLPHYTVPLFPALAIIAVLGYYNFSHVNNLLRRLNIVLFIFAGTITCLLTAFASAKFSDTLSPYLIGTALCLISVIVLGCFLWKAQLSPLRIKTATNILLCTAFVQSGLSYQFIIPTMTDIRTSERIANILRLNDIKLPLGKTQRVIALHYHEPSLVYHVGTNIELTHPRVFLANEDKKTLAEGDMIISDHIARKRSHLGVKIWQAYGLCADVKSQLNGFHYSKGRSIKLDILRLRAPINVQENNNQDAYNTYCAPS